MTGVTPLVAVRAATHTGRRGQNIRPTRFGRRGIAHHLHPAKADGPSQRRAPAKIVVQKSSSKAVRIGHWV